MGNQDLKLKRLQSLQVLRGVASVWVFCYHWGLSQNWENTGIGRLIWTQGFLGVDIFFVLSGFVNGLFLLNIRRGGPLASWSYLKRRFWKIVIPAWVSVVWMVLASWTLYESKHGTKTGYYEVGTSIFHSFLFVPTGKGGPPFYGYMFHYVLWSLFYEMIFYVGVSLTMFLKRFRMLFLLLLLLVPVCFNPVSVWNPYEPSSQKTFPIYQVLLLGFSNPMMLEFVLGVLGASIYFGVFHLGKISSKPSKEPKMGLALLAIVFSALVFLIFTPVQRHGIWPNGFVAFVLVVSLAFHEEIVQQKYNKFLVYLGALSFPLFLTHPGCIEIWHQVWAKWNSYVPFGWAVLVSLILSFALAHGFGKALKIV